MSGTRQSPNDPKLTYDPWWSEEEKYSKNREICKLLKWQKNILWRMSFIFFPCLSQLSEVPGLWTCLLCCLTGSIGEFSSHLESKISDEVGSFPHSYSSCSSHYFNRNPEQLLQMLGVSNFLHHTSVSKGSFNEELCYNTNQ